MNQNQLEHLYSVLEESRKLLTLKYIKGAEEHQSTLNKDFSASQVLDMAIEESIDMLVYLLTLKELLNDKS